MSYASPVTKKSRNRVPRKVWFLLVGLIVILIAGILVTRNIYYKGLEPVSDNQKTQIFTVKTGSPVNQIADDLQSQHLIRSAWALKLYVHSKELTNKLQAGTYAFSPSQGTKSIVTTLTKGKITTDLVTILPGRRIDQVRADLINDGFTPADVDQSLNPTQYADLPVLSYKPASANTLEGLLWPDSFQKDATTSASVIVRESLTEMGQHLTPDIQAAFVAEGLTTYQGLILASVVLQEVNRPTDQAQAAQVFLTRLKTGMMLGSDAGARYGAIAAGKTPNLNYDSPYNSHIHTGLPPTPISTINATALAATAHPASTNYLYFVTGDDGTTYFSTNLQDHQAFTDKYCHKLCGQ
ncbi:MAG: Endolytic transglycosylase MltG [Candidatus Saccharibacteria bacterium]|nr:Endolytic transglycosylase MltG [Candidatus Saccharibacteria bacterium]